MSAIPKPVLLDIARAAVDIAYMERARTAVPEIEDAPDRKPVDVLAWLETLPLDDRRTFITEALYEAIYVEGATPIRDVQQILGSRIGQRVIAYLQPIAEGVR